jgi:hypothetical protein
VGVLDLHDLPVENLPLSLEFGLQAQGRLAGQLELDWDPTQDFALEDVRGTLEIHNLHLNRRAGSTSLAPTGNSNLEQQVPVVKAGRLRAHLKAKEMEITATFPHLWPGRVPYLPNLPPAWNVSGETTLEGLFHRLGPKQSLTLDLQGPHLRLGAQPISQLSLAGSWQTTNVYLDRLALHLTPTTQATLEISGTASLDQGLDRVQGSVLVRDLDLASLEPWLGVTLPAHAIVGGETRFQITSSTPQNLRAEGQVSFANLEIASHSLGSPSLNFLISPEKTLLSQIRFPSSASVPGGARAAITATTTAVLLDFNLLQFPMDLPHFGKANAFSKVQLTVPLPETGKSSVLGQFIEMGRKDNPFVNLEASWSVEQLSVVSIAGKPLFQLPHPVQGSVQAMPFRVSILSFPFSIFQNRGEISGNLGPDYEDILHLSLDDVSLGGLLQTLAPSSLVTLKGQLSEANLDLRALIGKPQATLKMKLTGEPRIARWFKNSGAIHQVLLRLPELPLLASLDPRSLRVESPHVQLQIPLSNLLTVPSEVVSSAPSRIELHDFPLEFLKTSFPSRHLRSHIKGHLSGHLQAPPHDPLKLSSSLVLSVTSLLPTTTLPTKADLELSVTPSCVDLHTLILEDQSGLPRFRSRGHLDATTTSTFWLQALDLPLTWAQAMGVEIPSHSQLSLELLGQANGLPVSGAHPLIQSLQDSEWRGQALKAMKLELRIPKLTVKNASQAVLKLDPRFLLTVEKGILTLDHGRLDIAGHLIKAEGTLSRRGRSNLRISSSKVPLSHFLGLIHPEYFEKMQGFLNGDLALTGGPQNRRIKGNLAAEGMNLRLPFMDSVLAGSLQIKGDTQTMILESPGLSIDKTPLQWTGSINIAPKVGPLLVRSRLQTQGLSLRRGRSNLTGICLDLSASATLPLTSSSLRGSCLVGGGSLILDDAGPLYFLRQAFQNLENKTDSSPQEGTPEALPANLPALDLKIEIPNPVKLRSPLVDFALIGKATLLHHPGRPLSLIAEAELIKGSLQLHQSRFVVKRGRASLRQLGRASTSKLDFLAESQIAGHRIQLKLTGSLLQPIVTFSSTPNRSEAELLYLLSTGTLPSEGNALTGVGTGIRDFTVTSSLNRMLSSSLGLSGVRVRRSGGVTRVDLERHLDNRTTVSYSRGTDSSDILKVERRLKGATTLEAGQKTDFAGSRPFLGIKRRIRLR